MSHEDCRTLVGYYSFKSEVISSTAPPQKSRGQPALGTLLRVQGNSPLTKLRKWDRPKMTLRERGSYYNEKTWYAVLVCNNKIGPSLGCLKYLHSVVLKQLKEIVKFALGCPGLTVGVLPKGESGLRGVAVPHCCHSQQYLAFHVFCWNRFHFVFVFCVLFVELSNCFGQKNVVWTCQQKCLWCEWS